jgi:hypothetical protein
MQVFGELAMQWRHTPFGVAAGDLLRHELLDHHLVAGIFHLGEIDEAESTLADDAEQAISPEQGARRETFAYGGYQLEIDSA